MTVTIGERLDALRIVPPVTNEDMVGILTLAHEVSPGSSVDVVHRVDGKREALEVDVRCTDGTHVRRVLAVTK